MLIGLTGCSGSGKSSMQSLLLKRYPTTRVFATNTTRQKRPYEKKLSLRELPYHFLTKEEFEEKIQNNEFFEYEKIRKGPNRFDYYGTIRQDIENAINSSDTYIIVLEPNGAKKIKSVFPEMLTIFIAPPSIEILKERALARKTETEEEILARIDRAISIEIPQADDFDGKVINDDIETAFAELVSKITNLK